MVRVCFVCSSKRRLQRCLTVWNQRSFHRLIVKLQLPFFFFIHHRYIFKFTSLFYFLFLIFYLVEEGKEEGREERIPALQKVATQEFYTHWLPLFLIHEETRHIHDPTRLFSYVCFAGLFVCLFCLFVFKATARCSEAPDGKEKFTSLIFVCCWHFLVYACIKNVVIQEHKQRLPKHWHRNTVMNVPRKCYSRKSVRRCVSVSA